MEGCLREIKNLILPAPNHKRYNLLINELYSKRFDPVIDRDINRKVDGIYLKEEFGFKVGTYDECSVLEMLIALSGRFDGNSGFDENEVYTNFWIMIENLGLLKYDDMNWSKNEVWKRLFILENRTYEYNGFGGLFPLKHPEKDQRNVEIWDQMQEWLIEKYGI